MSSRSKYFKNLDGPPSRRPPTPEQRERCRQLQAEINAMHLYGTASQSDLEAIQEKIKHKANWWPVSAGRNSA